MTAPAARPDFDVLPETPSDAAVVDGLVLAAFGPGRFAKTAERLREGAVPAAGFVAWSAGRAVGSVRLWPVRVGDVPALFLGPIAVEDRARRDGVGARLVQACVEAADRRGSAGLLLVGDMGYFGRFGFEPAAGVVLPGPVDRRRVLWRGGPVPAGPVVSDAG